MAFVTSFERHGIKKGLLEVLGFFLDWKFGPSGRELLPTVAALNLQELRRFARFLAKADTLDEVHDYLNCGALP